MTVETSTVLVTGRHRLLVPALVGRLLTDGHRVLVPSPPLLPGLTVRQAPPRPGPPDGAAPQVVGPEVVGPEVVEHDPEDPDVPVSLRHGVDLVLHLDTGPDGDSLVRRSTAVLDALFALRVAEVNGARLVVASVDGDGDGARTGALEGLVAGYRSAHDVDTVLARVTECYGPGLTAGSTGVVARMVAAAVATGTVVVDARDHRRHTPCFVDDVVDGLLVLAARPHPGPTDGPRVDRAGPVVVGPSRGQTTTELAEQVARATGADVRVVGLAAPREKVGVAVAPGPRPTAPSPRRDDGRGSIGWRPRVHLAEGLRRCLSPTEDAAEPLAVVGRSVRGQVAPGGRPT